MKQISHFLSSVFSPFNIPTFCLILAMISSDMLFLSPQDRVFGYVTIVVGTILLPLALITGLKRLGVISSIWLNARQDRFIPYSLYILCYISCGYLLVRNNIPVWYLKVIYMSCLSLVVATLITLKWKISAHMTGMGGLCALALGLQATFGLLPMAWIYALIVLSGMVGTARIHLNCHTFGQVVAGFLNGFIFVLATIIYW